MNKLSDRNRMSRLFCSIAVAAVCCAATPLHAAVVWHESLAAAKAAAASSRRPVLVIFTASWSAASDRFVQTTLATPEASAIVSNCFEPVKLDVDANADFAKRLGVSHLPTACIVGQDDALLARFDCPESSAEFVSQAARGIQQAAQPQVQPQAVSQPQPTTVPPAALAAAPAAATPATPPVAAPANTPAAAPAAASRPSTGSAFSAAEPSLPPSQASAPSLPASPPGWPAEPASKPLDASVAGRMSAFSSTSTPAPTLPAPGRPLVEPQPAAPQPWLSQQSQATPSAPTLPGATATQPPAYPATPYPASAAATTAPQAYPATPSTAAAGYPSTAYPSTPPALPIYSGTAPTTAAAPALPSTTPPATAEDKPKESNAFVAFFKDPMSAFKWPGTSSKKDDAIAKPSAGATPQPAEPRTPSVASRVPTAAPQPATDVYGSMPVGLEGYCPVTLVEKSTWVEGRPQWGARHRGRTYLFAGAAEQQAFLASPDRYAPALSGDDPVLAFDSSRQVPGQRRYGVTYQSRIYLFSSPETRNAFTVAPEKYTTRVMLAENPQAAPGAVLR